MTLVAPLGEIGAFRFWCQKVLPAVYDDSLSYYELLCKVIQKLNEIIEVDNVQNDYIEAILVDLQQLRDDFDSLEIIDNPIYTIETGVDLFSNSAYALLKVPKERVTLEFFDRETYFYNMSIYNFVKNYLPDDLVAFNGNLKGVVVNNGLTVVNQAYADSQYFYILGVDTDGEIMWKQDLQRQYTGPQLIQLGYEMAFGIWSPIMINLEPFDWDNTLPKHEDDPNTNVDNLYGDKHTRTIFGFDDDNYYVATIDGRLVNSRGATFSEMVDFCTSMGMKTAFNLDGGGSSQLWTCNNPTFNFVFPDNSDANTTFSSRSVPGLITMREGD